MKELTSTQPMTDANYEAEAERLLEATRSNLQAMQSSQERIEKMQSETQAALDDVFRILDRIASGRSA